LRVILVIAIAIVSILSGQRDVSASGATHQYQVTSPHAADPSLNHRWGKMSRRQTGAWGFYADLSYYADPEYFFFFFQMTRVESLYWVARRPVRVCK